LPKNFADGQGAACKRVLWLASNLKFGSWGKKLKEELNKIGLGYIWYDPKENIVGRIFERTKEMCIDIK
jgi:hypothetical protein